MSARLAAPLVAALVALAAPAVPEVAGATEVEPFGSPPDPAALAEDERRVWSAGDDLDRSIRRARNLVRDEALLAYVGSVLDGLTRTSAARSS